MRKLLGLAVVAALAGCGSDLLGESCTSGGAAKAQVSSTSCTLAPGNAQIAVTLCADCLATSAGCVPELRNGALELAPNYCVNSSSSSTTCPTDASGCNAAVHQAICSVTIPADGTSSLPLTIVGANNQLIYGTVNISPGAASSCTL